MYLDRIEIHGFKSFGDSVKLKVPQGITAVIGPNGSGKSNVADAIRWVLGEQSAKTLRGSKMEDIIFAGTERRKPLGYAEVAMYINNEQKRLPVEYSEVAVKRRVYRSGESEYFLNGSLCRLKDIQELFMDTGVGKEGYSIIGQGQMDKVLSSKPDDRRSLFEEAAGIYKYKMRKIEAEKKLEKEKENLQRVEDILLELEDRLAPLEIEAQKTKAFLALRERLKKLDLNVFLLESEVIKEALDALEQHITNLEAEITDGTNQREKATLSYQACKQQRQGLYDKMQQIVEDIARLERQQQNLGAQIEVTKEKIVSNETLVGQIIQDTKRQENAKEEILNTLQLLESKKVGVELEHKTQLELLLEDTKKVELLYAEVKGLEESLVSSRTSLYEKTRAIDRLKAELENQQAFEAQLVVKEQQVVSAADSLTSDVRHQTINLEVVKKNLAKNQQDLIENKAVLAQLDQEKNSFTAKKEQYVKEKGQLELGLQQATRQMRWLEQIKDDYEGYYQSVKEVLKVKKNDAANWKGIIGVVGEVLTVPKDYETAIVTALGATMQHIVTQSENDAKQMIQLMKARKIGKATFLPLDTVKGNTLTGVQEIKQEPGVLGLACELVSYQSLYEGVVASLLGRIFIVDTMENASRLAKKYHYRYKLVTLDGETFHAGGSLSGGSSKNTKNNIFSRNRELQDLQVSLAEKRAQLEKLEELAATRATEEKAVLEKWDSLYTIVEQLEKDKQELVVEMHRNENALALTENAREGLVKEQEEVKRAKEEVVEKKQQIALALEATTDRQTEGQDDIEQLEKDVVALKLAAEEKREGLTEQKIRVANTLQNIGHIQEQIQSLKEKIVASKDQTVENDKRMQTLREDKKGLEDKIIQLKKEIEGFESAVLEHQETKRNYEEENKALGLQEETLEGQVAHYNKHLENLKEERYRLENKKEVTTMQKKKQSDTIWEQYELTYSGCLLYKEDLGELSEIKKEADVLRIQIKAIGNVNVNAVEEFEETNKRFVFLTTQKDDIIKAEESLMELIDRLQMEMHEIFRVQFAAIAQNFSHVFEDLFGGGRAFLQLTDEENVLESGIDIIAQPPGKKLQNMTLLSGGERSLTAIALLFAILKLNPSPFCVLDEIEAALDDANVLRFSHYLSNLSQQTQFVVITHRKGTMEQADTLYGVTMQERGVSTVLSIKLEDATDYLEKKSS